MMINNSYSFLAIGKTQESKEAQEFKKYVGVGSSFVVAVNPTKKKLEEEKGKVERLKKKTKNSRRHMKKSLQL